MWFADFFRERTASAGDGEKNKIKRLLHSFFSNFRPGVGNEK